MSRPVRFTVIIVFAAAATVVAAVGGWRYARASAPVSGPIVVISIDTLRADHLPAYGYTRVKTPALDGLAADGVVFERAYSHAPQTLPAHVALFSGELPFETGVRDNVGFAVKPGARLLPQMLRDRGFTTGGVVSTYLLRADTGIAQGFDFFDGDMPPAAPPSAAPQLRRDGAESERIAEHWLDTIGTGRAFLFLHLYEPHAPYAPPQRYEGYAPYDAEIAYADDIVGRLIRYLKTHQLYDRSTVVVLSDHGEGLGDHGEQGHGLFVYDEAIHVPLIVKSEQNVGAGRRVSDVVQHIDLVPTILDLIKAPGTGALRGRSLKPLLEGTGRLPDRPVYSEALYARYHFGWSGLAAVTDGSYHYIQAPREELYDRSSDPREQTNIAAAKGDERAALRGALDKLAAAAPLHQPAPPADDARERLAALGYVGSPGDVTSAPAGDSLADPKDKSGIVEGYRAAVERAGERQWPQAIAALQQILRDEPTLAEGWTLLAMCASRVDHLEQALDGYRHVIDLRPQDPSAYLGAATTLSRLRRFDDARDQAQLAADVAPANDKRTRVSAHDMLARIALARHDAAAAREEAALAHEVDATVPLGPFVEGRILYDQGKFDDAMPLFEQAIDALKKSSMPIAELHFYAGDTLARLERYDEAAAEFLEELQRFPQNVRARGGLATAYQATGRTDEAEAVVADMTRIAPTPESYALAAKLFTMFGDRKQADAVRAEARRAAR